MRRPNAANRRPETYPRFQVQLRRVALPRDMINRRIEQPARGKKLDPGDPKMRALEAYITSRRKSGADGIRRTLKILSGGWIVDSGRPPSAHYPLSTIDLYA